MIRLVTGPMNSGKTTRLMALYQADGKGDGIVMVKAMDGDRVHSYMAHRLATGEERLLVIRDIWKPDGFEEACRIGPYCFSGPTLQWADGVLKQACEEGQGPVYLDEVGLLEVEGKGFGHSLEWLLRSACDICLSVRSEHMGPLLTAYGISDYEALNC